MKQRTRKIVTAGVLSGLIILMSFTPVGYLRLGVVEISFLMIPVSVGGILLGPTFGLILGTVFGATSFVQCFTGSVLGGQLLSINPFFTFLMCVPTRALCGFLTGYIFRLFARLFSKKAICYYITGLLSALLNTILFVGVLLLLFYRTDYIQSVSESLGANTVFAFIIAFVGLNGLLEMIATSVIGGTVSKVLEGAVHHSSDGDYV